MKRIFVTVLVLLLVAAAYWLGTRQTAHGTLQSPAVKAQGAKPAEKERKLLYYRNPMGQPDTSPTPKKDSMGMDYIAVYEGEEETKNQVSLDAGKMQKLGVRTEPAALRELSRAVRIAGRVEVDERRVFTVAPKFEGWIDKLYVNATGQAVSRGQTLFDAYSPELVSAQKEYAIAARGLESLKDAGQEAKTGIRDLAESSLMRLKNWDVSSDEIARLRAGGEAKRTLSFGSPATGIVTEKKAIQGSRFMPGDVLYQIADLSSVWVLADVPEQDLALVRMGQSAKVNINAYPGREFAARISFVYPTVNVQTRTTQVRLELANPGALLKPAMYAGVELSTGKSKVLSIPNSAVLTTGRGQVVLVEMSAGRFEPRAVILGLQGDDYVEVKQGLVAGETVVVSANFLIDSESNLKAALGAIAPPKLTTELPTKVPTKSPTEQEVH